MSPEQQRLKQVPLNLLTSAIKYNRLDSTVTLSCEPVGEDRVCIVVLDAGYGISEAILERLFTRVDHVGAGQTAVEGSGLGLALSIVLIGFTGGRLGVESIEGEESRFCMELPLTTFPAVAETSV